MRDGIFIYYVRRSINIKTKKGRKDIKEIVGVVAFQEAEEGRVHRGIAVVSPKDQAVKKKGRDIAKGRLLSVEKHAESMMEMSWNCKAEARFMGSELMTGLMAPFKMGYGVCPTPFEEKLLNSNEEKHNEYHNNQSSS